MMNKDEASLMLSAIGITNTIGRIVCGLLGSIRRLDIVLLHILFLIFGACLNTAIVFFFDKTALYVYAALYGFVLGMFHFTFNAFRSSRLFPFQLNKDVYAPSFSSNWLVSRT